MKKESVILGSEKWWEGHWKLVAIRERKYNFWKDDRIGSLKEIKKGGDEEEK
jgi:hypothetical protein